MKSNLFTHRILFPLFALLLVLSLGACQVAPATFEPAAAPLVIPAEEAPEEVAEEVAEETVAEVVEEVTEEVTEEVVEEAAEEVTEVVAEEEAEVVAEEAAAQTAPARVAGTPTFIVDALLRGYLNNKSESDLGAYLNSSMRAQLAGDADILDLLELDGRFRSFSLTLRDNGRDDGEAAVRAALNYKNETLYRRITLTNDGEGFWTVSGVEIVEPPAIADDAGQGANEFLTEIFYNLKGDTYLRFLSEELRESIDEEKEGAVLELFGIDTRFRTWRYIIIDSGVGDGKGEVEATLVMPDNADDVVVTLGMTYVQGKDANGKQVSYWMVDSITIEESEE